MTNDSDSGHLRCKKPWAWEEPDPILHQRASRVRWSISDLRYGLLAGAWKDANVASVCGKRRQQAWKNEWSTKKEGRLKKVRGWMGCNSKRRMGWVLKKGGWAKKKKKKRHPHFYIRLTHKHRQRSDTKGHIPLPLSVSFPLISDPEEHGRSAVLLTWTPSASLPEETSTNT